MSFPIEQLRLYVLTRHKAGAATKDIIEEMVSVHGQANTPDRSTVFRWIKDTMAGCFELVAFTCSPPRFSITVLLKGKTVDAECMIKFFRDTRHRFNNLKTHPAKFDDMLLQIDNARPHTAALTQDYLAAYGLRIVPHSPYSPDLNLCDRFLFTRLQESVKLQQLDDPDEVLRAAQRYCRSRPEETLKKEFTKLLEHCRAVVRCGGDYITS